MLNAAGFVFVKCAQYGFFLISYYFSFHIRSPVLHFSYISLFISNLTSTSLILCLSLLSLSIFRFRISTIAVCVRTRIFTCIYSHVMENCEWLGEYVSQSDVFPWKYLVLMHLYGWKRCFRNCVVWRIKLNIKHALCKEYREEYENVRYESNGRKGKNGAKDISFLGVTKRIWRSE